VVFCKSGQRSAKGVQLLKERFPDCQVFSLTGGIEAWKNNNKI
jgi:rhodanese-related sulfurtransferase